MLSVEGLRDCGAGRVLFRQVASLPRRCVSVHISHNQNNKRKPTSSVKYPRRTNGFTVLQETQRRTNMMRNVAMLSHVCAAMGLLAHASALGAPTGPLHSSMYPKSDLYFSMQFLFPVRV